MQADSQAKSDETLDLVSVLNRVFKVLDRNHDNVLQQTELDQAVIARELSTADAEAVAIFKAAFSEIKQLHKEGWFAKKDGITLGDLLMFEKLLLMERDSIPQPDSLAGDIVRLAWDVYRLVRTVAGTRPRLYGDAKDPLACIRPEAIRQGLVGDCYFLAALGSLVASNPQIVPRIISEKGDEFQVVFPGARDRPVLVDRPTAVELALYAQVTRFGIWPAVLEKAYGRYLQLFGFRRSIVPAEAADRAEHVYEALDLLTGQMGHWEFLPLMSDAEIASTLECAFRERRAVIAGSTPSSSGLTPDDLPSSHAFSVLGWRRASDQLILRNPWGDGHGIHNKSSRYQGQFSMTMAQFRRNFLALYYEDWVPEPGLSS